MTMQKTVKEGSQWQMNSFRELILLEIELHQPEIRSDRERLEFLLHESFMECGRSGRVFTRNDILNELVTETMCYSVWSQNFSETKLSDKLILLTYKTIRIKPDETHSHHTFRSSLWQLTESGWKLRFHQGTPTTEFQKD